MINAHWRYPGQPAIERHSRNDAAGISMQGAVAEVLNALARGRRRDLADVVIGNAVGIACPESLVGIQSLGEAMIRQAIGHGQAVQPSRERLPALDAWPTAKRWWHGVLHGS